MKRRRRRDKDFPHVYVKVCNKCTLCHDRISTIGDMQYRCQVCGGVEFCLVRKPSFIRAMCRGFAKPREIQRVLFK